MLGLLEQGWSPEQVAGRLKLEEGRTVIGCETIYRHAKEAAWIFCALRQKNTGNQALFVRGSHQLRVADAGLRSIRAFP